ncbi:hypothetical protein MBLNU459_g4074t1 [Dothideomycetes sp. NU459]
MRAIHITSFLDQPIFSSLAPAVVARPVPRDDELLIRVTHASPQQVDLLYAQGRHQNNNAKRGHVHPPFILGTDFAGIVESVPQVQPDRQNERLFEVGDRVMGSALGAFADYLCTRPDRVRKVPHGLDNAGAAALAGGPVSYAAVSTAARVEAGETVLVTGANGGLGAVACQVVKALGARVVALVSTEEKAQLLRSELGLRHVVAMNGNWVSRIVSASGGKGVDAVIDNIGCVKEALQCLKFGGRIVMIGFAGRNGVMEELAMNKILLKGATVIGYRFGEHTRRNNAALDTIWEGYLDLLAAGKIKPLVDSHIYKGVEEIPIALQHLSERVLRGKAVIRLMERGAKL